MRGGISESPAEILYKWEIGDLFAASVSMSFSGSPPQLFLPVHATNLATSRETSHIKVRILLALSEGKKSTVIRSEAMLSSLQAFCRK